MQSPCMEGRRAMKTSRVMKRRLMRSCRGASIGIMLAQSGGVLPLPLRLFIETEEGIHVLPHGEFFSRTLKGLLPHQGERGTVVDRLLEPFFPHSVLRCGEDPPCQ